MKKQQWIVLATAFFLVIALFAATQNHFFGDKKDRKPVPTADVPHNDGLSTDSILYYAKKDLPQEQVSRLASLENSVIRGDVADQKLHLMHQLARYWLDSARAFTPMFWYPYAWYTAEGARLENSQKSLSFAAHLFLDALEREEAHQVKHWEAEQAKDLFERSLKLDPQNDSAKVGLGATILYGGLGTPMAGISMIREVADKSPENIFAQQTLGEASLMSGQLDKAVERFKRIVQLQKENLKARLLLADTYEKMQRKEEAVQSYRELLPYIDNAEMKAEVEKRIAQLKAK